jgi:cytochrome c peroxidase
MPCDERVRLTGKELFNLPFPGAKNKRSCATCHVPEDNFTLTPARVERLLAESPDDPLFDAIDADDPTADTLTFEHLKKGLVRVWLTLPDNMDLIDGDGRVITPRHRQFFVWRGVPSIADSVLTAPYQLDGREKTLEAQAQGAIASHSEGGTAPRSELKRIANFERNVFTSDRARIVAEYLDRGRDWAPDVEDMLDLTPAEAQGRAVYEAVCAACHGGANKAHHHEPRGACAGFSSPQARRNRAVSGTGHGASNTGVCRSTQERIHQYWIGVVELHDAESPGRR